MEDLKKLLAAATPGPWYVGHNELGDAQGPMSIWPDANMIGAIIARCGPQQPWQGWYEQPAHDAALIVAAINALPGLIESARRVERLEAEMGRTERNRDMWKSQVERQSEVISIMRNALKEIAGSPSHGAGCNPEGFVSIARTALKGT